MEYAMLKSKKGFSKLTVDVYNGIFLQVLKIIVHVW